MNTNTPAEACSKSQAQVQAIAKSLDELEARLQRMTDRMAPVLSPDYPKPAGKDSSQAPADPPCSEHVSTLKCFVARIDAMQRHIADVMDRLDI